MEHNSECADAIHHMVNNLLTRDDFTDINDTDISDIEDMQSDRYLKLQSYLNDHAAKPIDMNLLMQVFEKYMKAKIVSSF